MFIERVNQSHRSSQWRGRVVRVVCLFVVAMLMGGCTTDLGGRLSLKSQSYQGTSLIAGFGASYYSVDDKNNVTVLLIDGPVDRPTQAVAIHMFWHPRAGRTPIDPTATNATIHYTIFSGDDYQEVGIYSGAGFVYPLDKIGEDRLNADVWQATLRLVDRSEAFQDLLGQAVLDGYLTATRDDAAVANTLHRLQLLISRGMGYPRWVDASR